MISPNLPGTSPVNKPGATTPSKYSTLQLDAAGKGKFILAAFKHLPGMNIEAMRKIMLKRITEEEMINLLIKGYLPMGLILIKPFTQSQLICRPADEWKDQIMLMYYSALTDWMSWWPLN